MTGNEYPEDMDEHVDIDNDTLVFHWKSPANAISHNFYFGADEAEMLLAYTNSPQFIGNFISFLIIKFNLVLLQTTF